MSIQIHHIHKRFGKSVVLSDINLTIEKGKIYGLIGPSGAGKTTLVKLIVGMDRPDFGTIQVLDKQMPNLEIMQTIGDMAQSDALYTQLTGKENLQFIASLYKLKKVAQRERIAYVAELVKLTEDLNKRVSAYSGGMKRRLSLAMALIHNPQILILDEPTVGIDPELRVSIWNELLRLKKEDGKSLIVTTHVMDEAEKCDQIAMIRDGKIIAGGTPTELKDHFGAVHLEEVFLKAGRVVQ